MDRRRNKNHGSNGLPHGLHHAPCEDDRQVGVGSAVRSLCLLDQCYSKLCGLVASALRTVAAVASQPCRCSRAWRALLRQRFCRAGLVSQARSLSARTLASVTAPAPLSPSASSAPVPRRTRTGTPWASDSVTTIPKDSDRETRTLRSAWCHWSSRALPLNSPVMLI